MQLPSAVTICGMLIVCCATALGADDPAPQRLQQLLKLFPEADADGDGLLTASEARAYREKLLQGIAPAANRPVARAEATPAPTHANLSYGPHDRNKLDLWLAPSDAPTPLIVFIHGGGFVAGDKSKVNRSHVEQCLQAGVSFAAINYRYRTNLPINDVLRDSARAIQFLRYKASELNLDKTRFAAYGGSAGAGTSLWLAFRDDLAEPDHEDPVLRESTRLAAAVSTAGQATYDVLQWNEVLGVDDLSAYHSPADGPRFYGLTSLDDLQSDEGKRLRADVDMLGWISADDPPVLLISSGRHDVLNSRSAVNHSPKHSEAVKARCDAAGVASQLIITDRDTGTKAMSPIEFLLPHLQPAPNR